MSGFRTFLQRVSPLAARLNALLLKREHEILVQSPSASLSVETHELGTTRSNMELIVDEIKSAIMELSESHFAPEFALPNSSLRMDNLRIFTSIYYCNLTNARNLEASIFGFCARGVELPLHNHPQMFGFMRLLRGRIRVASFSLISADELYKTNNDLRAWNLIPAKYEGTVDLSSTESTVVVLEPRRNNLHMVASLDEKAAFFDFFVPGYQRNECHYYALAQSEQQQQSGSSFADGNSNRNMMFVVEDANSPPSLHDLERLQLGHVYWLREIPEPSNLFMQRIDEHITINCI